VRSGSASDVGVTLKPAIIGRLQKRKKTTYWKAKEEKIHKYRLYGARLSHLAFHEGRFAPCPPSVMPLALRRVWRHIFASLGVVGFRSRLFRRLQVSVTSL